MAAAISAQQIPLTTLPPARPTNSVGGQAAASLSAHGPTPQSFTQLSPAQPSQTASNVGPTATNNAPSSSIALQGTATPIALAHQSSILNFLVRTWVGNVVSALSLALGFLTLGLTAYSSAIQAIYAKWTARNDVLQSCLAATAAHMFSNYCNETLAAGVVQPPMVKRSAETASLTSWRAMRASVSITLTLSVGILAYLILRPHVLNFRPVVSMVRLQPMKRMETSKRIMNSVVDEVSSLISLAGTLADHLNLLQQPGDGPDSVIDPHVLSQLSNLEDSDDEDDESTFNGDAGSTTVENDSNLEEELWGNMRVRRVESQVPLGLSSVVDEDGSKKITLAITKIRAWQDVQDEKPVHEISCCAMCEAKDGGSSYFRPGNVPRETHEQTIYVPIHWMATSKLYIRCWEGRATAADRNDFGDYIGEAQIDLADFSNTEVVSTVGVEEPLRTWDTQLGELATYGKISLNLEIYNESGKSSLEELIAALPKPGNPSKSSEAWDIIENANPRIPTPLSIRESSEGYYDPDLLDVNYSSHRRFYSPPPFSSRETPQSESIAFAPKRTSTAPSTRHELQHPLNANSPVHGVPLTRATGMKRRSKFVGAARNLLQKARSAMA